MPGSFQTHFPALRPINQGYICVGWTSTPRGGGGAETVFFVCKCTCIVCVCACVLPVRVHNVYVVWERREFCVFCIYQQRWEEVVDARLLLALQSELESWVTFFGPLSSLSGFSFGYTSFPPTHTQTHTHTHMHTSLGCCASQGKGSFFSTCVAQCLYVYFLKLLAHLDLSYPSFFHLCSLCFFFLFSLCLAVMSQIPFRVCSYD